MKFIDSYPLFLVFEYLFYRNFQLLINYFCSNHYFVYVVYRLKRPLSITTCFDINCSCCLNSTILLIYLLVIFPTSFIKYLIHFVSSPKVCPVVFHLFTKIINFVIASNYFLGFVSFTYLLNSNLNQFFVIDTDHFNRPEVLFYFHLVRKEGGHYENHLS